MHEQRFVNSKIYTVLYSDVFCCCCCFKNTPLVGMNVYISLTKLSFHAKQYGGHYSLTSFKISDFFRKIVTITIYVLADCQYGNLYEPISAYLTIPSWKSLSISTFYSAFFHLFFSSVPPFSSPPRTVRKVLADFAVFD